jgi:hypothetical protein
MSNNVRRVRVMEQARSLSEEDFTRVMEADRPRDLVSIKDLAAELGVCIRTLRRWNRLPDAPKRYRRGRRLMYRRADVQTWFLRWKRAPGPGDARDGGAA